MPIIPGLSIQNATTPAIDSLAQEGIVLTHHYAYKVRSITIIFSRAADSTQPPVLLPVATGIRVGQVAVASERAESDPRW
jgi:hypothetical protein